MRWYADTSVLCSGFFSDAFTPAVTRWLSTLGEPLPYTPILRAELRNRLRHLARVDSSEASFAWRQLRAAERTRSTLAGVSLDMLSAIQDAESLSDRFAGKTTASFGLIDAWHVAAAQELECTGFATCDEAQGELAKFAGLDVNLFRIASRR